MVSFVPMNINDEESVELVLSHVDNAIQFGEDEEPKEPHVGFPLFPLSSSIVNSIPFSFACFFLGQR